MLNQRLRNTVTEQFVRAMPRSIKTLLTQQATRHHVDLNFARVHSAQNNAFLIGNERTGRVLRVDPQSVMLEPPTQQISI
jgi:hypothetical protein